MLVPAPDYPLWTAAAVWAIYRHKPERAVLVGDVMVDQFRWAAPRAHEHLLPAARDALGVSANPNGRACYDAVVRQFSTVAMPAAAS